MDNEQSKATEAGQPGENGNQADSLPRAAELGDPGENEGQAEQLRDFEICEAIRDLDLKLREVEMALGLDNKDSKK